MEALFKTILFALSIYWWILIGSAIFSWLYAFNVINSSNRLVNSLGTFFYNATEPVLRPIRRVLPDLGGIDISPIIVLIILFFVETLIKTSIAPMFGVSIR